MLSTHRRRENACWNYSRAVLSRADRVHLSEANELHLDVRSVCILLADALDDVEQAGARHRAGLEPL